MRTKNRPAIPKAIRSAVIERDGMTCTMCGQAVRFRLVGEAARPDDLHLDHVRPWAWGGGHTVDNLRVTCARCNLARPRPEAPSLPVVDVIYRRDRFARPLKFRPGVDKLVTDDRPMAIPIGGYPR